MARSVELRTDAFELDILPEIGGCIARFRWHHPAGDWIDVLRPMRERAIAAKNSEGASCFPLLPFSNRLRHGRFAFAGQSYELPLNTAGPHVEHGHGWQRPWDILSSTATEVSIGFAHDPAKDPTWPFAYSARQSFKLGPRGLTVTIGAQNLDHRPMPIGLGLHPYFPRTPACRLKAAVDGFWETDAEVMPLRLQGIPAQLDLRGGLAMQEAVADNVFTGFSGQAEITWPEHNTRLRLSASTPLRFLVLYVPDAATSAAERADGIGPYFCAEPVSNLTDAFNLAGSGSVVDTGMLILQPQRRIEASIEFLPQELTLSAERTSGAS